MNKNNELNVQIESPIEHKTLKLDDYEIHYFISGKKNNNLILFLHPAFSDHRAFNQQIDFFSKKYRVITIDLIGHGLSKAKKSKDKIDASSKHIEKILVIEGFDKAHIVGISMGSLIAQYFALKYPEKIETLTALGGHDINKENKEVAKAQRSYNLSLILTGEYDIELAKKMAEEWHSKIGNSKYLMIENAGHCANIDKPLEFNKIVNEFIEVNK